ncbi:Uncharacterised protein [Vibrio cholerae]|nr:Uncharacterised protein [Vibrio cholerae]CSB14767.1 Uncharacterised protein [Vibrio cholerae]CSB41180.1 Uncharacterised protein [Vibrio cholerae]CSC55423.1 Uncharacterised protein [Vibrio cholerae]CSC60620.1 Uncharacterised protein [Vibrio cholerae]
MGSSSKPTITVAPVVVNAEKDSKNASVTEMLGSAASKKGNAPALPITVQNNTTIKKPSRALSSCL